MIGSHQITVGYFFPIVFVKSLRELIEDEASLVKYEALQFVGSDIV